MTSSREPTFTTMTESARDDRHLALRVVLMPRDTNAHGSIFGGVILSHIDLAGAVGASHEIRLQGWRAKPLVTVGMNSVEFHQPVFVGDLLSFWTRVVRIGNTSISVHVAVESEREGGLQNVTEAEVTYVAVDLQETVRHPIPIRDADVA
jgi:acyl-CoA thioesterase YciA